MSVWSSAFHHQFLDGNPANFNAVPGELSVLPDGLVVRPTPPPDERGFPVRPGQRLDYVFARPFEDVVGADIRLDVRFPVVGPGEDLSGRVALANGAIRLLTNFLTPDLARIQLFVGGDVMALSVPMSVSGTASLQVRWHTHGQAQVWVNGALRGYEPALATGASFTVDRLMLGHHSTDVIAGVPGFMVRNFRVKLLRRDDPARFLDQLFPLGETPELTPECARRIDEAARLAQQAIRGFMNAAVARLTTSWREGQAGGPFSPEATAAHQAATAAGLAFVEFMLHGRQHDAGAFLEAFGEFLKLIRASDPSGYAQLLAQVEQAANGIDLQCLAPLQPVAQTHAAALQQIADLLQQAWAKAQNPGGPNG